MFQLFTFLAATVLARNAGFEQTGLNCWQLVYGETEPEDAQCATGGICVIEFFEYNILIQMHVGSAKCRILNKKLLIFSTVFVLKIIH